MRTFEATHEPPIETDLGCPAEAHPVSECFTRKAEAGALKVYLAGPMRGLPHFNFPAFMRAAENLRAAGYEVFNPAERDEADFGKVAAPLGDEHTFARDVGLTTDALRRRVFQADTEFICRHAAGVALLSGWERSKGACAEKALAEALGLMIFYLDADGALVDAKVAA